MGLIPVRALLLALVLVAATLTVAPSASAGCPPANQCVEEAREIVDFLLGGPGVCWDPDHPLLNRICWAP